MEEPVNCCYRILPAKHVLRQILATTSCGLVYAGIMSSMSFPAVAVPVMTEPGSRPHLTTEQASWFATLTLFMCIPGSMLGGLLCERLGPRRLQLLLTPVLGLSFAAMSLASWECLNTTVSPVAILIGSRVAQGVALAPMMSVTSVYPCEISDDKRRGLLTSLTDAWSSMGFFICFLLGCFFDWHTLAWLLPLFTFLPGYLGLLMSLESPLWLARQKRDKEAIKNLSLLRGSQEEVTEELKVVQNTLQSSSSDWRQCLRMIIKKPNFTPVVISVLMLVMKQFSGSTVFYVYIVKIFQLAGVGLDPRWSSVVVASSRLLCNFLGSGLLDRLPRKTLLLTGITLAILSLISIGTFFFIQNRGDDVSWLKWLPLLSLTVFMIGYSAGIGPTTWLMSVEMLPDSVRSLGFGIGYTCYSVSSFVVSKTFEDMLSAFGLHGTFWSYASGCFLFGLLVLFFVPETQGLSRKDIERIWQDKAKSSKTENVEV